MNMIRIGLWLGLGVGLGWATWTGIRLLKLHSKIQGKW
jgi:hypothetical protein